MRRLLAATAFAAALAAPVAANADVRITEFMYQGVSSGAREFIELTNLSAAAIGVAGWSYNDDNPNNPVTFGDAFGTLGANESVILTELSADAFRSYWGLSAAIRVFSIGGNSNLGNGDTINIYDSPTQTAATLVDTLVFPAGTTAGVSRNRPNLVGPATNGQFVVSSVGDAYGSAFAPTSPADLGNPGRYPFAVAAVPEPASWAMLIAGFALAGTALRRPQRGARTPHRGGASHPA